MSHVFDRYITDNPERFLRVGGKPVKSLFYDFGP